MKFVSILGTIYLLVTSSSRNYLKFFLYFLKLNCELCVKWSITISVVRQYKPTVTVWRSATWTLWVVLSPLTLSSHVLSNVLFRGLAGRYFKWIVTNISSLWTVNWGAWWHYQTSQGNQGRLQRQRVCQVISPRKYWQNWGQETLHELRVHQSPWEAQHGPQHDQCRGSESPGERQGQAKGTTSLYSLK